MESVSIKRGVVGMPAATLRAIASAITIGGGGSVGREGPIVALAAAMASYLGRLTRLYEDRLRILVAAGAASGFAAAYDTPIAGTLFVLEVIVGSFAVEVVGPTAVAAVIGTIVSRLFLHHDAGPIYFTPDVVALRSPWEVPAYILLGVAAAAGGALFLEALRSSDRIFTRLKLPLPLKTLIGGLIVGSIGAVGYTEVFGNGYETTALILRDKILPTELAFIYLAKVIATSATVGSGAPGGVFTPTLLLGAALGSAVGHGVDYFFPEAIHTSAFVLVGMGAMLAATTNAPLLSVVFIFEVSRDFGILLPLLLSCVIASIAARRLNARSVYEEELAKRGLAWEGSAEERAMRAIRVRDVMRTNVPLLPLSLPVKDVVRTFLTTRIGVLYIGDKDSKLIGAIDFQSAKGAIGRTELEGLVVAEDLAKPVPTLDPDLSVVDANEKLWHAEEDQLPVVEMQTGRFLGILTRRDLLGALDREILRRNVLLAKVRWRADEGTVTDFFELPSGQRLEQVPVPPSLEGKTLADADLRSRFGFNVLAIVRPRPEGGADRFSPRGEDRLSAGDILVVIATRDTIEEFRALR
jgi:chloride channel protein, CIC family